MYPATAVEGLDMTPVECQWVPPNASFYVADFVDNPFTVGDQYDLIHARNLTVAVTDWDSLLTRCLR